MPVNRAVDKKAPEGNVNKDLLQMVSLFFPCCLHSMLGITLLELLSTCYFLHFIKEN